MNDNNNESSRIDWMRIIIGFHLVVAWEWFVQFSFRSFRTFGSFVRSLLLFFFVRCIFTELFVIDGRVQFETLLRRANHFSWLPFCLYDTSINMKNATHTLSHSHSHFVFVTGKFVIFLCVESNRVKVVKSIIS